MSVPKRKRKESSFEVFHHLTKMRKDITDLLLRDFGYSSEKFQKNVDRRCGGKAIEQLTDIQKSNYEQLSKKRNQKLNKYLTKK